MLSEGDESLLCLQAQLSSDEESQFHEFKVMSLAIRSTLEVLEHQLEPYLHGSLHNPSNDILVRSQAAPLQNMLSEQTLGLVDYHVQHAPNANIGFIDGKANVQNIKHYPGFRTTMIKTYIVCNKESKINMAAKKSQ